MPEGLDLWSLGSLVGGKHSFSQANRLRRRFHQLVTADELDRLFEIELTMGGETDGDIGGLGADIGQLFFLGHVDVEIGRPRVLTHDHPFVNLGPGPDEELTSILKIV